MLPRVEATDDKAGARRVWLELACTAVAAVAQDGGREALDRLLVNMREYGAQRLPRY